MHIRHFFLPLAFFLCISGSCASRRKDVIAYYPSWDWKNHRNLVNPKTIPYEKITILNYAFSCPQPDGSLVGKNPEADANLLVTGADGSSLIAEAHRRGVKVMLSIGGWEDTSNFPGIAADPARRARFAAACADQVRRVGFDGIDIDWEYPGYVPHNGSPVDKRNFTLLLQQVRDSLDAVGKPDGHKPLLSAALSIAPSNASNIEVEAVASVLDFLNLMTYDCFGVWDPVTNHNSPLYAPAAGDSTLNVDAAFRLYHDRFGVPADRINLGVPFYGHAFAGSAELHGRHAGADTTICFEPGNITYVEIVKRSAEFERRWDDRAKVPYLVSKLRNLFVSFDDEASVALKADYVVKHGARGLIVWEVTDDFFDDGRTPLLDAIHRTFQGKP